MASKNIPVNGWPQLKDLEAVQPILDRLDKIEAWKRTVKEETFMGEEITIPNALALPARSLKTTINAIQDLHGYDKPWVGGAYKNKLPMTVASIKALNTVGTWSGNVYTWNGNTFEILTDSANNVLGIKVGGANNGTACRFQVCNEGFIGDGSYYLNGSSTEFSGGQTQIYTKYSATNYAVSYNGADTPFTVSGGYTIGGVYILVDANISFSSPITYKPMIRLSTESDASFAPYSNICPISGRTAVAVDDCGANICNPTNMGHYGRNNSTGEIDRTEGGLSSTTDIVAVKPSTAYVINRDGTAYATRVYYYDTDKRYISNEVISNGKLTTPNNAYYLAYQTGNANGALDKWMIKEGTDTAYIAYISTNATIQLGTTVYGADINWDTGVATVTDGMVDLGDLTWTAVNGSRFLSVNEMPNVKIDTSVSTPRNAICSQYVWKKGGDLFNLDDAGFSYYIEGGENRLFVKDLRYSDAASFKAAMDGVTLVYELATPTTIQLTPEQLQMLKGYNRITLSDGYGTIELKALTGANWS